MTQEEMIEVIHKIAKNHRNKDFSYFTKEDIEQEVWVIALKAADKYRFERGTQVDDKKAFEHWMNRVVSNRLKNLYRNKFVVPQRLHKGKSNNLVNPVSIDNVQEGFQKFDLHTIVENKELWQFIVDGLNECDQEVMESLLSGESVGSYYKIKLLDRIKVLLDEFRTK